MKLTVPDYISGLKPYKPGKPLEELEREYGISDSIKLASNENPLGPSPKALEAVRGALMNLHRYPDGSGFKLKRRIAEKFGVDSGRVVLGNGSDEIIGMLTRAFLQPGDAVILPTPSFLMYAILARSAGAAPVYVPLKELSLDLNGMKDRVTSKTRMLFICNPNNPTGTFIGGRDLGDFIDGLPEDLIVVVDEAYIEFVRQAGAVSSIDYQKDGRKLVTLRTFSKAYGLAGLRIGFGIMPPEVADLLNRVRQPFNANNLAQAGALAALDDTAFFEKTMKLVHSGLDFLYRSLDKMGIEYFPSQANFFLINVRRDADAVFEAMLKQGVIVRSMTEYGFPEYIRINVGLPAENERFLKALAKVLG
ncbi:MAG: histidinol-phosphate transaminase [Thermodesulfobacteriota bacterium]